MSGRRSFGSIRKNRAGRYEARYTGPDGGKYTAGHSFVRKGDASAFLARTEAEISEGTWTSPKEARERERAEARAIERAALTFSEWSAQWLSSLERLGRTPKTIQTHTYRMRRLVEAFGGRPLASITADDVDSWYQGVWQAKGPGVARPLYMTLSACMNAAVKAGLIVTSPCKVPEGQKHRPVRERERQVATPEEVRAAADSMPARLRIAVLLAAWCQTRLGELTGLQRRDFDLDSTPATLRIERQVQYLTSEGPVELPPKSAAGVREIVIPASLVPALRAHLDSYVSPAGTAWLLCSERSPRQPLHPNTLRGAWERAREDAGIPWFKFHDLRHTGLTIFAQQGATLAELLHRGGHSDVDVALRYQHATRERDAALAARMDSHVLV
ncbi:site-specific integrase [Actinomyces bouchesdurhonensis]|uniref:site-specific integrase n=1 Tax=Actinomyces bouchesdurhonensis TaxID=1852361 RepID=UPI003AEFEF40